MDSDKREDLGSSANWNAVDVLLFSWLAKADDERARLLDRLRHDDPDLAAAVTLRIDGLQRAGFLQPTPPTAMPGETLGSYRVLRTLGAGGMGTVYLAEHTELRRRVALKLIRPERLADADARERFRREARAIAGLDHPGICAVYEVGSVGETPFLAMQYVEGQTLAQGLAARRGAAAHGNHASGGMPTTARDLADVLLRFERVAGALHAAHEAGVVHRDVKPANLMIATDGRPVLLDFGLAREQSPAAQEMTLTHTGDVLGTPAYMSPELVRGRTRVDRRSDVYSLAVTLYECLTLQRPFQAPDQLTLYESIEREPSPDPRCINPSLPLDLVAVVQKAMEKEPERRYATALEFARELHCVRTLQPVRARRIGTAGQLARWSRRNPLAAITGCVLAALTAIAVALLVVTLRQGHDLAAALEASRGRALIGAAAIEQDLHPAVSLHLGLEGDRLLHGRESIDQVRASLQALVQLATLRGHRHYVLASALAGDGSYAVTGSYDGTVRVFDRAGKELQQFDVGDSVTDLVLLETERHVLVATAYGGGSGPGDVPRGRVLRLDLDTRRVTVLDEGSPRFAVRALPRGRVAATGGDGLLRILGDAQRQFAHGAPVWKLAVSPRNPDLVATTDYAREVRMFDLQSAADAPVRTIATKGYVDCVDFSPTRDELLIADYAGDVRVVDLQTGAETTCRHGGTNGARLRHARWLRDGEHFVTAGDDGRACVWTRTGALDTQLIGHHGPVFCCAESPDGTVLATAGEDAAIALWSRQGKRFAELRGHASSISGGLHFSSDGRTLLSASTDSTARLWDLSREGLPVLHSPGGGLMTVQFVPNSAEVVATTVDGRVLLWDAQNRRRELQLPDRTYAPSAVVAPAHQLIVTQFGGAIHRIDLLALRIVKSWRPLDRHDTAGRAVALVGDQELLVLQQTWGNFPPALLRTTTDLGEQVRIAELPPNFVVHSMASDRRGERVYLACGDGSVRCVRRDGTVDTVVEPTGNGVTGIAMSPDGRWLVTGCTDMALRLYAVGPDGDATEKAILHGHEGDPIRLRFAPDNTRFLSTSRDRSARLWSVHDGLLGVFRGHDAIVYDACLRADDGLVLTGSLDGTARFWHARPADLLAVARARLPELEPAEIAAYEHLLRPR